MSHPSNQMIERYYFEQFREHYRLPDGELQYTDKPDVIISGAKVTGIEITNLYIASGSDPASEQVQRNHRLQTLERAQILHRAAGGKPIEISVDFRPDQLIREVDPVAQALAKLAKRVESMPSRPVNPLLFNHIPQLRFVYNNAQEYPDPKWRPVQCYSVPCLSVERLREVVNEKSEKAKAYQPCDTYWLLLVVDFMDWAQDQHLEWPTEARLAKSPFDRILLYKPQFAQVVQVAP